MGHCSKSINDIDYDQLLIDKFTAPFRPGYTTHKGITLPVRYNELQEAIDNFEVFDDDVWICSFPKTGTTWCQEMIWMIGNNFDYCAAEENLGARFPFLEVSVVFDFRPLKANNIDFVPPIFLDDSIKFVNERQRPRFIKTHLPWDLLPIQIRNGTKRPKIIYITRNPKEVCVSYFHHAHLLEGFVGSFEEFVQLFLAGKVIFGPFWRNVLPFWERREQFLFLKYEEMKNDLQDVVERTAEFLGKTLNDVDKAKLLKHLSFESMKLNKAVNYEPVIDFHRKHNLLNGNGTFMRSGKNASRKMEMSEEQEEEFNEWIKVNDENDQLGYFL